MILLHLFVMVMFWSAAVEVFKLLTKRYFSERVRNVFGIRPNPESHFSSNGPYDNADLQDLPNLSIWGGGPPRS